VYQICRFDYAGDLDKCRSMTGYVSTLSQTPLYSTVYCTLSTTEVEYMTMTEAMKEVI